MSFAPSLVLAAFFACGGPDVDSPEPVTYTVVAGDTLFLIAKRHGVALEDLVALNELDSDLIEIGQLLQIPVGGEAPPTPNRRSARKTAHTHTSKAHDWGLTKPQPQPCLPGPQPGTEAEEDLAFSMSQGLQVEAANAALRGFAQHTLKCVPTDGDFSPAEPLPIGLHVGCDGRVISVSAPAGGGWSEEVASCIESVLQYVPFPPHSLPDGDWIRYPLTYTR